jgi:hypothetical protein
MTGQGESYWLLESEETSCFKRKVEKNINFISMKQMFDQENNNTNSFFSRPSVRTLLKYVKTFPNTPSAACTQCLGNGYEGCIIQGATEMR